MVKVVLVVLLAFAAAALAARVAYDATTAVDTANEPWALGQMEFVAWNGQKWTAWVRDDTFEQRPHTPGKWQPHANASVAFRDWDGEAWQAKVDGGDFLLAARGDWLAGAARADAIRYIDWAGRKQIRTPEQLRR